MAAYTFYLHDRSGAVPAFEIEVFERDEDATTYARRLLRDRPRYDSVEVVVGERRICELRRTAAPPGAASFGAEAQKSGA